MNAKQPLRSSATTHPMLPIRAYAPSDEAAVVALWLACGLTRPWNDPRRDIARKLTLQAELFLIGTDSENQPVATAMVGYDGHRGWVNYLAVAPALQRQGWGRGLMAEAETLLLARGWPGGQPGQAADQRQIPATRSRLNRPEPARSSRQRTAGADRGRPQHPFLAAHSPR